MLPTCTPATLPESISASKYEAAHPGQASACLKVSGASLRAPGLEPIA